MHNTARGIIGLTSFLKLACTDGGGVTPVRSLTFVPKHKPPSAEDVSLLQSFVAQHEKIFLITGAGVSTESGIPDYRSEGVGLFATSNRRPIKIQEFLSHPQTRRRYWARNFFAWPRFSSFNPNIAHQTIRQWESLGKIGCLVTQNVDGLHRKAGSTQCVELHGTAFHVICLSCDYDIERAQFQKVLESCNEPVINLVRETTSQNNGDSQMRPDGDLTIAEDVEKLFSVPSCPSCGGMLKPDIVFFGDNVPKAKVHQLYDHLDTSDSILVLGSSLQTFSAFRYLIRAKQMEMDIAVVTLGPTRADTLTRIKLTCRVGEILPLINL